MIDLSKLKVGDDVVYADATSELVTYFQKSSYSDTYFINDKWFQPDGVAICREYQPNIVEIIPKEDEMSFQDSPTVIAMRKSNKGVDLTEGLKEALREDKPKRFVDLLAEGEEFIKFKCGAHTYKLEDGVIWVYPSCDMKWEVFSEKIDIQALFREAEPAQNPEKSKKVVYQVLFHHRDGRFIVSQCKYSSLDDARGICSMTPIHLIEESREEIE